MAGPSKKMCVSDEVLYGLLQENEYSDISRREYRCDREINVKISSRGEQTVSSDEEEKSVTTAACSMAHGLRC
jgi:hypothetical protein